MALCAREGTGVDSAVNLTVTDCVSGIFGRRLGERELDEMRQDSGMAEFGWSGFLRLLSAALRGTAGCSTVLEMPVQNDGPLESTSTRLAVTASEGLSGVTGKSSASLTFRFKLEAAALMSQVRLDSRAVAPTSSERYLRELRDFMTSAVGAAANNNNTGTCSAGAGAGVGVDNRTTTELAPRFCGTSAARQARSTHLAAGAADVASRVAASAAVGQRLATTLSSDLSLGGGLQQSDPLPMRVQSAPAISDVGKVSPVTVAPSASSHGSAPVAGFAAAGSAIAGIAALQNRTGVLITRCTRA